MPLNLVKLCVGVTTLEELADWITSLRDASGKPREQMHTTRMIPRRMDELLDGGSLYWVIKGNVQARQRLLDVRPFTDGEGIERCHLVLDRDLVPTYWQPRRAFQGWRYLTPSDAPADLSSGTGAASLPPALRLELAQLGLL
jgi:hypothetical protein